MYRLTITAERSGIDADHILWRMFRLLPHGHTEETTIYACRLQNDLPGAQREILTGFVEEGDILKFACEQVEG